MSIHRAFIPPVRVENLQGPSGAPAVNQFVVYTEEATVFQSYSSVIAVKLRRPAKGQPEVVLGRHWEHSKTTLKHLKQFLGHGAVVTRRKLMSGEYGYDEGMI